MANKLFAVVRSQGLDPCKQRLELVLNELAQKVRLLVTHLGQLSKPARALDQRREGLLACGANDVVAYQ